MTAKVGAEQCLEGAYAIQKGAGGAPGQDDRCFDLDKHGFTVLHVVVQQLRPNPNRNPRFSLDARVKRKGAVEFSDEKFAIPLAHVTMASHPDFVQVRPG